MCVHTYVYASLLACRRFYLFGLRCEQLFQMVSTTVLRQLEMRAAQHINRCAYMCICISMYVCICVARLRGIFKASCRAARQCVPYWELQWEQLQSLACLHCKNICICMYVCVCID